jgi:hypothetical protein
MTEAFLGVSAFFTLIYLWRLLPDKEPLDPGRKLVLGLGRRF